MACVTVCRSDAPEVERGAVRQAGQEKTLQSHRMAGYCKRTGLLTQLCPRLALARSQLDPLGRIFQRVAPLLDGVTGGTGRE